MIVVLASLHSSLNGNWFTLLCRFVVVASGFTVDSEVLPSYSERGCRKWVCARPRSPASSQHFPHPLFIFFYPLFTDAQYSQYCPRPLYTYSIELSHLSKLAGFFRITRSSLLLHLTCSKYAAQKEGASIGGIIGSTSQEHKNEDSQYLLYEYKWITYSTEERSITSTASSHAWPA
jgi:hypothetical protein